MQRALAELTIPGWEARARSIRHIGHGESFDAWLIEDAQGTLPPIVARVARRPDMPKPIEQEATVLRDLEGMGVAPRLWTYDGDPANPALIESAIMAQVGRGEVARAAPLAQMMRLVCPSASSCTAS